MTRTMLTLAVGAAIDDAVAAFNPTERIRGRRSSASALKETRAPCSTAIRGQRGSAPRDHVAMTLSCTRIMASFSGRVSLIQATEGTLVTADKTAIAKVVASDALHVAFNMPEATLL